MKGLRFFFRIRVLSSHSNINQLGEKNISVNIISKDVISSHKMKNRQGSLNCILWVYFICGWTSGFRIDCLGLGYSL